jgi:hypothetical protein
MTKSTPPRNRHECRRKLALTRRGQFLDRMTRREAAAYLTEIGCPTSEKTLAMKAWRGGGPLYSLVGGRAIYAKVDLDEWVASMTSLKARTRAEHEDIARRTAA